MVHSVHMVAPHVLDTTICAFAPFAFVAIEYT
jgi:hypothetical protein